MNELDNEKAILIDQTRRQLYELKANTNALREELIYGRRKAGSFGPSLGLLDVQLSTQETLIKVLRQRLREMGDTTE